MRERCNSLRRLAIVLIAGVSLGLFVLAAAPPPASSGQNIIQYLNFNIDWFRRVESLDPSPINAQDLMFRESARRTALDALRHAFDFARAAAPLLENAPAATRPAARRAGSARPPNLAQMQAAVDEQIAQLQTQIDQLNQQIKNAPPESVQTLTARRDKLVALLDLAKERQQVISGFAGFMSGLNGGTEGLLQQINNLEREVPQLQEAQQPSASAKPPAAGVEAAAAAQENFRPESAGLLGLVSELFTIQGRLSELHDLATRTERLSQANEKLRVPLREQLTAAIHRADAIAQAKDTDNPQQLESQRDELENLTAQFKQLAAAAVPLGEQGALIQATRDTLDEWHTAMSRMYRRVLYSLLIRLGIMAGIILLLLGISKLWGRVTFRYVTDARRRRQFLLLRRIVVGCVIVIVIVATFVAEFGQLATFAGLITAGIAVALQTVILSGFAYFFFIGRYGVRVGDRVTISGITGDVVDIGLFRLYLLELAGNGRDLQPTGRIVVFSNSVLFQPNAFFKQLPGADYTWHEVALTLAPDSDHQRAEKRLLEAVESVYAEYRDRIEQQYEHIKHSLHLPIPPPKPQGRLRFTDAGLEFVVRYPVEIHRAAEIDDKITRRLLEAIEEEPRLRLVPSSAPKIQPVDTNGQKDSGRAANAPAPTPR